MRRYGVKRNWVYDADCPCCRINKKSKALKKRDKHKARREGKEQMKDL